MFDNNLYNLFRQIVEEHTSLWRIKDTYKKDAADYPKCKAFWEKLEAAKEEQVRELEKLIRDLLS